MFLALGLRFWTTHCLGVSLIIEDIINLEVLINALKGGQTMKAVARRTILLLVCCFVYLSATSLMVAETRGEGKVNINIASIDSLASLPHVGEVLANRIIDYRNANGPFRKVEDLMNVKGIGVKLFERLEKLVTIH